jgi:hypothetical protein
MSHSLRPKSNVTPKPVELDKAWCGNVLHPVGSPAHSYYCPRCRVNNILRNLKDTSEEWKKEGGPVAEILTHRYDKLRESYAYFRIELAKYMWQLELFTEKEHGWETAYLVL